MSVDNTNILGRIDWEVALQYIYICGLFAAIVVCAAWTYMIMAVGSPEDMTPRITRMLFAATLTTLIMVLSLIMSKWIWLDWGEE